MDGSKFVAVVLLRFDTGADYLSDTKKIRFGVRTQGVDYTT